MSHTCNKIIRTFGCDTLFTSSDVEASFMVCSSVCEQVFVFTCVYHIRLDIYHIRQQSSNIRCVRYPALISS